MDIEKELNEQQKEVVLHADGPCLVLAGAGSGKTRVITYRTAYLLSQGIEPENILLMTFTNKAAKEMNERINELRFKFSSDSESERPSSIVNRLSTGLPFAGTFHHIAYKILKKYAEVIEYKSNFTVLDQDDSLSLFKICIKENISSSEQKKFPAPRVIREIWSYARNALIPLEEALEIKGERFLPQLSDVERVITNYEKKKKEANSMDFDDLLTNFLLLLSFDDIRQKFAKQFQYVLVDEYQDTNRLQAKIVKKLSSYHKNILAVGDDAQSIYSFRAADINNILDFSSDFPEAKIFKLEINYRSSQEILSLANAVIENNHRQYKKDLQTVFTTHKKPEFKTKADAKAEARFVAEKIEEKLKQNISPNQIAVLFRAAHHSQPLEVELVRRGIEYDYRGGVRFFERAHIKDVLAYLRILNNIGDETAWRRTLLREEGIGPVAVEKVLVGLRENKNNDIGEIGFSVLSGKGQVGWRNFLRVWQAISPEPILSTGKLIKKILLHGYKDYLENEFIDSRDRVEDIEQLINFADQSEDLSTFLSEVTLSENYRTTNTPEINKNNNKIVLSTVHQAKGLEWESVFIINMSASGFPNERAMREENGLEEERRLFYVAITRAKKELFLSYPAESGNWNSVSGPSMFLEEVDSDLLSSPPSFLASLQDLNDEDEGVSYVSEDTGRRFRPGSFLKDLEDL